MTPTSSTPTPSPKQSDGALSAESGSTGTSVPDWLAALTLWPEITAPLHQLAGQVFGDGSNSPWLDFTRDAMSQGLIEPGPENDAYILLSGSRGQLEEELAALGGAQAAMGRLLDAWMTGPDPALVPEVTVWARELERWDVLERVWLVLGEQTAGLPRQTIEVFRLLPEEARQARPILTWASGAAASLLADTPVARIGVVWERLMLDSAMLHSNWSSRARTEEAVIAGTFRMIGEQRQPGTQSGQSLASAWRTKQEIDAFIDARSRAGEGPNRQSLAVFRAFSARLALSRFDPLSAVNEARWAMILSDWAPVTAIAAGVEALALSVSSEEGHLHKPDPSLTPITAGSGAGDAVGLGGVGLRDIGGVYLALAEGHKACRGIDRDDVDRCLGLVSSDTCAPAGVWSIRVALAGIRAALWGEPDTGLHLMGEEITRLSRIGREQDEPLGRVFLRRTQGVLLLKAGAFAAALRNTEKLSDRERVVTQASIMLWSGQYPQAIDLTDAGTYDSAQSAGERHTTSLIRAAAGLLQGSLHEDVRRDAIREMKWLIDTGAFIHLALLPRTARQALVELVRPEISPGNPNFAILIERLGHLNDSRQHTVGTMRLTQREQILLPLLATNESVPQIAQKLHVSVNTVRKQVATLREKFDADTRAELIRKARIRGAIQGNPGQARRSEE